MKTKKKISTYPWGKAELLTTGTNYKIKNITVKPSQRQSYQTHAKRAEAWIVLSGEGKITIDDEDTIVGPAAIVMITPGMKHRIHNTSDKEDLVFAEFQYGEYISEDDIVRYDDDYGRHQDNWADVDADLL
tara:strand:+ start:806 stop:1198 length:393 start_codon:yes stop_codon:yes gene_type:complete